MREKLLQRFVFVAFGLSGTAALVYEVVWTRSFSTVMGSTTYALSTMLAAFMTGLSFGALIGSRLSTRVKNMVVVFALCEVGIGISGLLSIPVIKSLTPIYISSFYALHLTFDTFSLVQFLINFSIMGIPTTLMGITFPLVIKHFSAHDDVGKTSGELYAVNTLGAIVGSICAGFLLIPLIGLLWTAIVAASLNLIAAFMIFLLSREYRKMSMVAAIMLVFLILYSLFRIPSVPFFSYYSAHRFVSKDIPMRIWEYVKTAGKQIENYTIFHHEGSDGEVYVTRGMHQGDSKYVLINNGKFESGGDISFPLLAYLPYFYHTAEETPRVVVSIGLGSGTTLKSLSALPLETIYSVEISEGIIEANRRYLSPGLFYNKRIKHIEADGRNYLLLSKSKYDLIIVSPSWAVETSSAALLTDEFFSIAASKLNRDGVISVWVDYFLESNEDMDIIMKTISNEFNYMTVWKTKRGIIVTATNSTRHSYDEDVVAKIGNLFPNLREEFKIALTNDKVRKLSATTINTDDKPVIEFHNAKNIILGPDVIHN